MGLVGQGREWHPPVPDHEGRWDGPSLFDADYVRDLVAKTEPDPAPVPEPEGPVTMTGSPAAMAAFIHKAAVEKAKNDTADRKHKAATGAAMESGSYPISSQADLDKAIHAVGRGNASHGAIRKHIIQRAQSLGVSSKIPDNWNRDGSLKGDSVSKRRRTVVKDIGPDLDKPRTRTTAWISPSRWPNPRTTAPPVIPPPPAVRRGKTSTRPPPRNGPASPSG